MYEEFLEDGQNLSNQAADHQNDGNVHANIGQQLIPTTSGPESIDQMPIIFWNDQIIKI